MDERFAVGGANTSYVVYVTLRDQLGRLYRVKGADYTITVSQGSLRCEGLRYEYASTYVCTYFTGHSARMGPVTFTLMRNGQRVIDITDTFSVVWVGLIVLLSVALGVPLAYWGARRLHRKRLAAQAARKDAEARDVLKDFAALKGVVDGAFDRVTVRDTEVCGHCGIYFVFGVRFCVVGVSCLVG